MPSVLYIAQLPTGGPFKIGQTQGCPRSRVRRLSGQALQKYQLLRVFETESPRAAEAIAFDWLSAKGVARVGGARDEHLQAPLDLVIQACEAGVRGAKRAPAYARAALSCAQENYGEQEWVWPSTPFWRAVAQYPLVIGGKRTSLKELVFRAVKEAPAKRRIRKLGIEQVCFRGNQVEFLVEWQNAEDLKNWVLAKMSRPPKKWHSIFLLQKPRLQAVRPPLPAESHDCPTLSKKAQPCVKNPVKALLKTQNYQ